MTYMPEGDRPAGAALVAKYLLPAERVVIVQRRHWAVLAGPISITAGGLLIVLALDTGLPPAPLLRDILWIAWALLLSWLIWHLMEWWWDRFIVTDHRIMLVTGLITRKVAMMPLVKVTDMSYQRSVLARMLGYGEFIMESAGQDQALRNVTFVAQPDWLYREMCALLFAPEQPVPVPPPPPDTGPTWRSGSEPTGPSSPRQPDEGPRFGPGYGPDDTEVDVDVDSGGGTAEAPPPERPSPVTY